MPCPSDWKLWGQANKFKQAGNILSIITSPLGIVEFSCDPFILCHFECTAIVGFGDWRVAVR